MSKLTDEEVGRLLRETFADKEDLVGSLPEANKPQRRRGPVLVAAASVLVVLGGAMYAADGASKAGPGQAQATTAENSTNIYVLPAYPEIWAAAIKEILTIERPAAGWPAVQVLDAPHEGKVATVPTRGQPFTVEEKAGITNALTGVVPVRWVRTLPSGAKVCEQPAAAEPYVTLGPIVSKPDHVEVATSVWRGCLDAHWLTYRLDKKAGRWQVTGTVGPQAVS
jgi:hypothetical protein